MRSHQTAPIHQQQQQHQHHNHNHNHNQHHHHHQHHQQQQQHLQQHHLHQMQFAQEVTIDESDLNLSASGDGNTRIVNILHPNGYTSHTLCRQGVDGTEVQLSAEAWGAQLLAASESANAIGEQLTDEDRNLAAALVQFVQRQPLIEDLSHIEKVVGERTNSESSNGLLEHPIRLYHSPDVEEVELRETDLVDVPSLQSLAPLPPLKRTHDAVWYHPKTYKNIEDVNSVIEQDECGIEVNGVSLVNNKQHSRKSLPHKKRITKKLKKHASHAESEHDVPDDGQQSIDIIQENVSDDVHSAGEHTLTTSHMVHNGTHADRALFICQLCGQFYGEDQLQFFHHLKQHYEPNMLDNMQHDDNAISMDKISDSLVVSNTPLPDSLVELSLDDTNKTLLYQSQAKIPEYDSTDKSIFNTTLKNSLYSIDDKVSLFQSVQKLSYMNVDKLLFSCTQCPKTFKRQKLFEAHTKDAHSKTEEMSEFSEPEDLMEGIHVVEPDNEEFLQEDLSSQHSNGIMLQTSMDNQEQYILPHLTIDHGSIHQSHLNSKEWFKEAPPLEENTNKENSTNVDVKPTPVAENNEQDNADVMINSNVDIENEPIVCPMCHGTLPTRKDFETHAELCHIHFKDDMGNVMDLEMSDTEAHDFAPMNETDPEEESEDFDDNDDKADFEVEPKKEKKALLTCMDCGKQFRHRNSIIYHMLSHEGNKPFQCEVCQKSFFTACALKVHARLHSGVRPYKCIDCGKKFRQWGDLKYHFISIHSNLKQHQCEYCGKNFARKYSLIIHRRIHTGEKNYRCEFCNKTFRASSYLQNHRKIHTGEKPYPCELCGKRFRMKGDMRRHIKIHSKTKTPLKEKEKSPEKDENSSSSTSKQSKPSTTLLQDSKEELKIEKEEAQAEMENDDNSEDVQANATNEETASSPPSDAASLEDTKLSSNFPIDNNGAMYVWPVFIS